MAGGFGEHLKREREMRGVSLAEIAAATRISVRFLGALENETWDLLPGGVFNRGFVRTISRYLGLEEESLLAEYALARGINTPPVVTVPAPAPAKPVAVEKSSKAPKLAFAAAAVLIVIGGGWFGWQWYSARRLQMMAAEQALPATPSAPSAPSTLWEPAAPATQADSVSPWTGASAAASDMELRVMATRQTSLEVTSDGLQTFAGMIGAGENRNFSAKANLIVAAQDAGAIQLELNGQALAPIGPPGQPGKVTLANPAPKVNSGGHD